MTTEEVVQNSDKPLREKLTAVFPGVTYSLRRMIWQIGSVGRENRARLGQFHNRHAGQRCFIIGNGPSLKTMDMTPLKDECTFSLNRGYLYFDRIGAPCTYQVAVNTHVLDQFRDEFLELDNQKFFPWGTRRWFPVDPSIHYLAGPVRPEPPRFSEDIRVDMWSGATVTYVALQLAYFMGFSKVILIGVDHNFATKGEPHKLVTSQGDDPNHFAPDYFGKGVKWQLPDLDTSELAYTLAREAYKAAGRDLVDATVDGKLTIFPKVSYMGLF